MGERNAGLCEIEVRHTSAFTSCPFFGDTPLGGHHSRQGSGISREHRQSSRLDAKTGKPKKPARATLHHEIVTLRQILKTANRKDWIAAIPDMSAPYKTSGKVRASRLVLARGIQAALRGGARAGEKPPKAALASVCETLHDYILFMGTQG